MRLLRTFLIAVVVFFAGWSFGWLQNHYVVPVFTYHHVSPVGSQLDTVSPESFEAQMAYLKRHGYQVISFDDLVDGIAKGRQFTHHEAVITFDDGYNDNYTYAYPILKKYGFPAIVFLISDQIGLPGFLTWPQVKEMDAGGFMAGAHTRHHPYLPDIPLDRAQDEIMGSKRIIEENLGKRIDYFSYPSGGFTSQIKTIVREEGFKAAGTTNRGNDKFNHDLFEIKRIRVNNTDTHFGGIVLWAKLSGYYNLLRQTKHGH